MSLVLSISRQGLSKNAFQSLAATARGIADSVGISDKTKDDASTPVALPETVEEVVTADVISGAPPELRHRSVRIYQPAQSTMQSGGTQAERWRIDWDILPGGGRWQNPLMGWASSADYMQGTRISFRSKEDAIHFAEKQGWDYYVQLSTIKRIPPKNYSENFLYSPNKLRIARTK